MGLGLVLVLAGKGLIFVLVSMGLGVVLVLVGKDPVLSWLLWALVFYASWSCLGLYH